MSLLPSHEIDGVERVELHAVADYRGSLTTLFASDECNAPPLQWNLVRSVPGTLRGIHAHPYDEYYVPFGGRAFAYLHDARRASPSFGRFSSLWIDDAAPAGIWIPAGVAHGVVFPEGGVLLSALSTLWDGEGELGCRWDDEQLSVDWPVERPLVSDRDAAAGSYADMIHALDAAMA